MTSREGFAPSKIFASALGVVTALSVFVLASPSAMAEEGFSGPTFRKGMWRFVRTLEIATSSNVRQTLLEREMTRCVDPTQAMKATFSSPSVGNCHSSRPEKINNKYVFSNRCDYLGPVSTVITVLSDEAYTEVNKTNVGQAPRTDRVVARRISDCHEDRASLSQPASASGEVLLQQDEAEGEPL
ncbi:DUF3617 family protein [Bradyrhizobium sp. BEA-2-5]|uniref:DUF3617 domain-containing protein n=1 Tax=Bradyrhizobium sp. BEA-2-5 TaxID=3080015 RepID=UPI00293EB013|nr:DUF3617 family protein [Bradyrhizobium sp. BEA-2-5]WOH84453.1 DUF3617 family protein [Bradyrhizobium sp. BEA-2-5]